MNRPLLKTFQILWRTTKWLVNWQRSLRSGRSIVAGLGADTGDHPLFVIGNSQIDSQYMKDNLMALYLVSTISCGTRYCGFWQVDAFTTYVVAVETGWKTTPEAMTQVLMGQYNSKEMAQSLVDSPTLMPTFKKDDYWYVDGFGDVIESNLSWNKEEMRKNVGHLFLFMKGTWQYSDNGIDWEPAVECFKEVA
jgi:hypothetical protein